MQGTFCTVKCQVRRKVDVTGHLQSPVAFNPKEWTPGGNCIVRWLKISELRGNKFYLVITFSTFIMSVLTSVCVGPLAGIRANISHIYMFLEIRRNKLVVFKVEAFLLTVPMQLISSNSC
jgi:hypothetical protein